MAKMHKRQQKALEKWVDENPDKAHLFMSADELPEDVYQRVYNMHPHEDFDGNVQRVLADHMNKTPGKYNRNFW